jgi:polysaccharide export outer membrane protein
VKLRRILLLLLLGITPTLQAQTESLTIGPGDVLHVSVLNVPELDERARVTDDGRFRLILGGDVSVGGLTPGGAAELIEGLLIKGNYILNPHVTVTVDQFTTTNVSIIGQVKSPGSYPIQTTRSILDVIALAGGLTEQADRKLVIERRSTKAQIEYTLSNDPKDALKDQPLVFPGDTVIIPKAYLVYVVGDVARPGAYPAISNKSHISVVEAIAYAGGTPPTAVPSHARIIHKDANGTYTEAALPLSDMQKGKVRDQVMQPDDIIYVPYSYLRNVAVNVGQIVAAATSAVVYTH